MKENPLKIWEHPRLTDGRQQGITCRPLSEPFDQSPRGCLLMSHGVRNSHSGNSNSVYMVGKPGLLVVASERKDAEKENRRDHTVTIYARGADLCNDHEDEGSSAARLFAHVKSPRLPRLKADLVGSLFPGCGCAKILPQKKNFKSCRAPTHRGPTFCCNTFADNRPMKRAPWHERHRNQAIHFRCDS